MFVLTFGQLKINLYINIEIYQYSVYHVIFMLVNIMFKNMTREHTHCTIVTIILTQIRSPYTPYYMRFWHRTAVRFVAVKMFNYYSTINRYNTRVPNG